MSGPDATGLPRSAALAWLALVAATAVAQSPEAPATATAPTSVDASAPASPPADGSAPAAASPQPAATEGTPPPATPPDGSATTGRDPRALRDAAQATYLRLMDEQRYEEAITLATQVLTLSRELHGERAPEIAAPLSNLATAELRAGNLAAAETHYRECIAVTERAEGVGSPRLVNPLTGLAETYMRGGLYAQANEAFQRALRLNHADAGFYNLEQVRILDGLSESYLALDKLGEANARQRAQVAIHRRRSGDDSPEAVAALEKLGAWYNRTGQYVESRATYQQARQALARREAGDPLAAVDTLLGEALTYQNEGAMPAAAAVLRRALALVDDQPAPAPAKRAEVLVALGDLYIVMDQPRSARQRYGEAWTELSGDESLIAQRTEYFAAPRRLSAPRLPEYVDDEGRGTAAPRDGGADSLLGQVLATMTIGADGRASDITIVESDPPGLLDRQVLRVLQSTAFRPQVADGAPVATPVVQFRHEFRYEPPPGPRSGEAPPAAPAAGDRGEPIAYPESPPEPGTPPAPGDSPDMP
jgi:TonB family protein